MRKFLLAAFFLLQAAPTTLWSSTPPQVYDIYDLAGVRAHVFDFEDTEARLSLKDDFPVLTHFDYCNTDSFATRNGFHNRCFYVTFTGLTEKFSNFEILARLGLRISDYEYNDYGINRLRFIDNPQSLAKYISHLPNDFTVDEEKLDIEGTLTSIFSKAVSDAQYEVFYVSIPRALWYVLIHKEKQSLFIFEHAW